MVDLDKETIGATEAAKLFGVTRPTFYTLAEEHGIKEVTERSPARKRPVARLYVRADVLRVYRAMFGRDPE